MSEYQQERQNRQITYCKDVLERLKGLANSNQIELANKVLKMIETKHLYFKNINVVLSSCQGLSLSNFLYLELKTATTRIEVNEDKKGIYFESFPLSYEGNETLNLETFKTLLKG